MSEKIVQLNEEIIKGQIKELVRGSVEETLNEMLEKDIKRLKGMLIERMGTSCTAVYNGLAESYTITYNPVRSAGISKDALERLKDEHPDIYDQYVTVSEWRRFHVKKAALQAA